MLAGLWAIWSTVHAATVDFSVVVDRAVPADAVSFEVEGRWLDESYSVRLTDAHGVRGDGIWSGSISGDPVRMLPVTLQMQVTGSTPVKMAATTEMVDAEGATITWALDGDPRSGRVFARRVALAQSPRQMERFEAAATAAGLGWFALVFFYVAWWATDQRTGGRPRRRGRG